MLNLGKIGAGGALNNIADRFFRKVDNMVWDITTGKLGIMTDTGIATLDLGTLNAEGEAENPSVSINALTEFGFALPAYALSVSVAEINVGDVIYNGSKQKILGWVTAKKDNRFELLKEDGTSGRWTPPAVKILGFDTGVLVVRSLMNMLGGTSGVDNLNGNIMQLVFMSQMMGNGLDDDRLGNILPFLLMGQLKIGGFDATTGGGMSQMLPMLMMGQMFGGGKSSGGKTNGFFDRMPPGACNNY